MITTLSTKSFDINRWHCSERLNRQLVAKQFLLSFRSHTDWLHFVSFHANKNYFLSSLKGQKSNYRACSIKKFWKDWKIHRQKVMSFSSNFAMQWLMSHEYYFRFKRARNCYQLFSSIHSVFRLCYVASKSAIKMTTKFSHPYKDHSEPWQWPKEYLDDIEEIYQWFVVHSVYAVDPNTIIL